MTKPKPPRPPRESGWLCAFASGLLFALLMIAAFPPFSFWGCSLVALAPLVWAADRHVRRRGPRGAGSDEAGRARAPDAGPDRSCGSARGRGGAVRPAIFAMIGTLPFYGVEHAWLWDVAGPGMPVLVVLMGLFPLVFVWALIRLGRRFPRASLLVVAPVLWGGFEFFRGTIAFDGYPWYFVGHPLVEFWPIAASGTVIGALGVSFLAAGCGATIGWSIGGGAKRWSGGGASLVVLVGVVVALKIVAEAPEQPPGRAIRIGVVQTNLPQSNKMDWPPAARIDDLLWFLEMTEEVARADDRGRRPDLIVWPETMFPGTSLDAQAREAERVAGVAWLIDRPGAPREAVAVGALAQTLLDRQQTLGIPMLVGAIGYDGVRYEAGPQGGLRRAEDAMYNSVFSIVGGEVSGRYDKVHLTPFGEVMPYISSWPWLERQLLGFAASGMTFELSAAASPAVLQVPLARGDPAVFENAGDAFEPLRIATPVCFESTDAALCRALVRRATNGSGAPVLIVAPTNDGWFGAFDSTREQHLQLARWRAIENRVPVVRAANTGISCAIDTRGRVIARGVRAADGTIGDARVDGVMVVDLEADGAPTLYRLAGDWLGWILLAGAAAVLAAAFLPVPRGWGCPSRCGGAKPESQSRTPPGR